MSYNGVGLQTPRGTGTSGYIQKNVASKSREGLRQKRMREDAEKERREVKTRMHEARRSAGSEVKEHLDKRWIEVQCMELRDKLEDEDVDEKEITKQVDQLRQALLLKPAKEEDSPAEPQSISRRELVENLDKAKSIISLKNKDDAATSAGKEKDAETDLSVQKRKDVSPVKPQSPKYVPRYGAR
ncbi:hypothetical protein PUMCH_000722 [Australozyma saopauloensis]|uniref:Pre-mRNA-splicing factor CWC21 n=1 Tax=Australozyma saopauloensis TaxID=291208 RepID=A0AAX4H5J3_9ASCO|nr:hypothetical protein PUMCH_000722 [[Candida] saopauloensis]